MFPYRNRFLFLMTAVFIFILLTAIYFRSASLMPLSYFPTPEYTRKYRPARPKTLPITDNFPLLAAAHSAADLPPVPKWNRPPKTHVSEKTPLFIGFTRNWQLLQQVVVSYITAGWPPEDIYVVENTGVMRSNANRLLSLQNPFFLNHTRLSLLGANVLITPTLLTFAQLQNFYIWHSMNNDWDYYWWSHMDVVALSSEGQYVAAQDGDEDEYSDFNSLYDNCVATLRNITSPDPETGKVSPWAQHFHSYDRLALVNTNVFIELGGWDTMIPFYMTDCDMHARIEMAGYDIHETIPGMIFDVATSLDDLVVLYRKKDTVKPSFVDPNTAEEDLGSAENFQKLSKEGLEERRGLGVVDKRYNVAIEGRDEDEPTWEQLLELEKGSSNLDIAVSWKQYPSSPTITSLLPPSPRELTTTFISDTINSFNFHSITETLDAMWRSKVGNKNGRNTWQRRQAGGVGEPFYRDPEGFDLAIEMTIQHGKTVFAEKWGHRGCDIRAIGLTPGDAWKLEHDWD